MPKLKGFGKKWQKNKQQGFKKQKSKTPDFRKPERTQKQKPQEECKNIGLKLPLDLKVLLDKSLKSRDEINAGLTLNKYAEINKSEMRKEKFAISPQCLLKVLKSPQLYPFYFEKQKALFGSMKDHSYHVEQFEGTLKERMVVGLGSESVYETSITISRNIGVPYIPGSALKGVANHHCDAINCKDIFGTQDAKGKVIFFDAFPAINGGMNIFDLDIMNSHYSDYYSKGETPGDWMKPVPLIFLTVKKDTKYKFCIASKNESFLQDATDLLKKALQKNGVGAKTSLGYGRFNF